jgi:hypothetical protein
VSNPIDTEIGGRFIDTAYRDNPELPRGGKPRPKPGGYYLRLNTPEAAFEDEVRGVYKDGHPRAGEEYVIPAKVVVTPRFTIESDADGDGTFNGFPLNPYYQLTSEPVRQGKNIANYSTLSSAFDAFGLAFPEDGSVQAIVDAIAGADGLVSQRPVFVSYAGQFKYRNFVKLGTGKYVNLNEKAFRLGDEKLSFKAYLSGVNEGLQPGWAPVGFVIDPESDAAREWTLTTPSENTSSKRVWANVEPTDGGFKGVR